ncbi:TraM recognition site of TraD and TraG [Haloechinothrix alba]|uniref:TraM recognition site of TraD and TraG n=1 Tax=Haloechinothrix alba TaxID=664784 RepID=A0A238V408_9PSEU|nr:TraM recognition domain-containing protein [Haloechinothrix alba]SNR29195.1 TraM recognition site of TraD and TraG [Haloechinothrix alba]
MSRSTRGARPLVLVKAAFAGVVVLGAGVLMQRMPAATPGREFWPWVALSGAALVLGVLFVAVRPHTGTAGTVHRWSRRTRRNEGVASRWTILRVASSWPMRLKASVLRPSLRELPWWRRWTVPAREVATPLARVGWLRIWSPIEDVTLRIGGPRTGKTGELAGRILDAPGAVIATSTRTDLVELTGPCRSQAGPVRVFNPSGLGDLSSSVTFNPLSGCEQPATAAARAADLLSAVSAPGKEGEGEFWAGQARRVLAALLHAAALGDGSMRDVLAWVSDPDSASSQVQRFLRRSSEPAYEQDAVQFLGTNERTRSSICATIMPALGWLTDATAAAAAEHGSFDVAALLAERGTIYMLGAEDAQVAPLVTALTGHIAREARRLAAHQPGGRLDPPLTLALDEAALICPVPLDNWTADMGGRGVTIHIAAQSRAQLKQRWGHEGAGTILNNAASLLIFGAMRDPDDLAAYSSLTGERYEDVPTWGGDGHESSRSTRRVPVLTSAQIAQLPPGRVLIIRRNMPAAVGKVQMAWKRHDVKAVARATRWAARLDRWQRAWLRFADRAEAWAAQDKFAHARRRLGVHLDIDRANTHASADADGGGQ